MAFTIHPLVCGSKVFDKSMMTYQTNAGTPFTIPIYAWLLRGGDKTVLVDTGEAHPIVSADREKALGGKIMTLEQGLERHGLTPEDIDIVCHTHLHNDHCENDAKCVNARIYVHEKELENIHDVHPLDYRYLEDHILEVEERGQLEVLSGDAEILPGLRMVHTPAHTEGGMSVYVETAKGTAVITGFCVIHENFNPPPAVRAMEMDVIPPGTVTDAKRAYAMLLKVKAEADIILPLHEPAFANGEPIG